MNYGVCFKCGKAKLDVLSICSSCYVSPDDRSQQIISTALSDTFYSRSELMVHGQDIKNHLSPYIEQDILDRAKAIVEASHTKTWNAASSSKSSVSSIKVIRKPDTSECTISKDNPFAILGASVRDNRQRIVELAEDKSLIIDSELCLKAQSELTNPRKRIAAEVSWLPGVAPARAANYVAGLIKDPGSVSGLLNSVPPLARANLLSAGLELIGPQTSSNSFISWILEIADADQDIVVEDVYRDINEDRAVAGFTVIRNMDDLTSQIKSRREHYKNNVLSTLNLLDSEILVDIMTGVLEKATNQGEIHAPFLVDEIVDSYRGRVEGFLDRESESILTLVENIENKASQGESSISLPLTQLDQKVRIWDRLAQPIQLSFKSRGLEHELSRDIAWSVRSMTITLVNEHGMLDATKGINSMLREIFAELPEVVDRLDEDKTALDGLEKQKLQQAREEDQWARSISYSVDIGAVFKNRFEISPTGVQWKNIHFSLESISEVRWGGVSHRVNGIPTGTDYTIGIGDGKKEAVISIKKQSIYQAITEKLWQAVCSRIMVENLQIFANGERAYFGSTHIDDEGVNLTKHKFFGSGDKVYCRWSETHIWSAGGSFFIGSQADKKVYDEFSYINDANTHILEQIIRASFKKPGSGLSNLLT